MTEHEDRSTTGMDSFTRFYNEWYPRGVGASQKLGLRDFEDAKEAAADAMRAVQAAWGNIETPEAYFQTILKRRVTDQLRKVGPRQKRETRLQDAGDDVDTPVAGELLAAIATHTSPEAIVVALEDQADLVRVLATLSENDRTSLYLESQGYSAEERAEHKGIPVSTERTQAARARRRCMALLTAIKSENKSDAVTAAEHRKRKRDQDRALKRERDDQREGRLIKKEGEEA
jgi:DNA-directed RNA polymerase specialized sigma24 family protein